MLVNLKSINKLYFKRGEILTVKEKIIEILEEVSSMQFDSKLDEDFMVSGYIDSFGYVQLLLTLQSVFDIDIKPEDQTDKRLRTVNGINNFITEKVENEM